MFYVWIKLGVVTFGVQTGYTNLLFALTTKFQDIKIDILKIPLLVSLCAFIFFEDANAEPPYGGTIFHFPEAITSKDPSTFLDMKYEGQKQREMFDRRRNSWIKNSAYIFNAIFSDGSNIEVQVNSEFSSSENAFNYAEKYSKVIGQLPNILRKDVRTVWIHKGKNPFGGGNFNLLIHTDQGDEYISDGILEETLIHEASHTSLDWPGISKNHGISKGWIEAQKADKGYISDYAEDYPNREDIAESFLPWVVVRYKADRIGEKHRNKIIKAIPNRLRYFDLQGFDMRPLKLNEKKQDSKTNQMRNAFSSFSLNDRKRIQGKLREYGYESLLDGIWGPGTLSAVRRYLSRNEIQSSAGLESVLKTLLGD